MESWTEAARSVRHPGPNLASTYRSTCSAVSGPSSNVCFRGLASDGRHQPVLLVRPRDPLTGAAGRDNQQLRRRGARGEVVERPQRVDVRPLQVLEHQNERRVMRQRLEQAGQLLEHPLRLHARRPAPLPLREARQPGRRDAREQVRHEAAVPAIEANQRVEEEEVRLRIRLTVETLAVTRPGGPVDLGTTEEDIAEYALAAAVLPGHDHEPSRRRSCRIQCVRQHGELGTAVDDDRRPRPGSGVGAAMFGLVRDAADEGVATADRGSNVERRLRRIAEREANLPHEHLDVVRLDVRVRPDRRHDRVLGNPRSRAIDEAAEQSRGLARQRQLVGAAEEPAFDRVETELTEILHGCHRPRPRAGAERSRYAAGRSRIHWT